MCAIICLDESGMAAASIRSQQTTAMQNRIRIVKPCRFLPPGSIVSAKLAAVQVYGRRVTASTSVRPSRLPVASTSAIGKRPDCHSTRSLPDGGSARSTKMTTVIHRSVDGLLISNSSGPFQLRNRCGFLHIKHRRCKRRKQTPL